VATDDNYCEYPSVAAAVSVLMITLTERRFFISDEGLFGIAAHNVIEGDSIWIVKGGKLPLVLRKVTANEGKRSNGESQVYGLVGDSYIHGIVDGERAPEDDAMYNQIFLT
jgi:hypothetical protein